MMKIADILIQWYLVHKRDLPWRETNDPYSIWVSEVILQQTRVEQGRSFYHRFIDRFPDILSLADASEDEVLRFWQGLGYYSRARNMLAAAHKIKIENQGVFPDNMHDVLSIKGIGPYTAAAVLSFAFDQPYPVMDGNVKRLISRLCGIKTETSSSKTEKKIRDFLNTIFDSARPALFNQAVMEFGALQCKPVSPDCTSCPLQSYCYASKNNITHIIPIKKIKPKIKNRYVSYYVFISETTSGAKVIISKRRNNDIWAGLYDFPYINAETRKEWKNLHNTIISKLITTGKVNPKPVAEIDHQLSHLLIHASFYEIRTETGTELISFMQTLFPDQYFANVAVENLAEYPHSRLIEKYLEKTEWVK